MEKCFHYCNKSKINKTNFKTPFQNCKYGAVETRRKKALEFHLFLFFWKHKRNGADPCKSKVIRYN